MDGDGRWRTDRVQERDPHALQAPDTALGAEGPSLRSHRKQSSMPPRSVVDPLVQFFESKLGTDLEDSPFWHMRTGQLRSHRPWEWIWRVASGDSAGHGTDTRECWTDWVYRHIRDHMFYNFM